MPGPDGDRRRHDNRSRARREYAAGAVTLAARPRFLIVELTRKCNLSCDMCRPPSLNRSAGSMAPELFERLAAELFPYAEVVDLRGWGESLILPDFEARLARTAASGAAVRIVTNLSFERPAVLDALAAAGAYVGVSLDGATAATLRHLRRGARLDLIERNLLHLSGALARHGFGDRLCLYVTCQAPNLDELGAIVDLAGRCGVGDIRFAPVTGAAGTALALPDDVARLRAAVAAAEQRAAHWGIRASLTASLVDWPAPVPGDSACLHPWTHCYIAADGRIGFCDHLIGPAGDPYLMGDLNAAGFEAIWNGPAWCALRREHLGARAPTAPQFDECAWCYRNRHLDSEDLLEPALCDKRLLLSKVTWP
ncbi:radical SAM protein [Zavarzinia compransoris]|uniref:Radical SAM protein n=1 Tax=Zavarzinia compransoris TaxID=1264899 RepID=A0A317E6S2_9PROT|nr:radical SAM protein [Zavarzinia compransoris]PWR21984.1 radical SAM protein [Zavarzinia compransoris]TDP47278.1 MoaA/NifB/PqqE/SkfB family radical SAM enzyme [Zavarzinia compransoris]